MSENNGKNFDLSPEHYKALQEVINRGLSDHIAEVDSHYDYITSNVDDGAIDHVIRTVPESLTIYYGLDKENGDYTADIVSESILDPQEFTMTVYVRDLEAEKEINRKYKSTESVFAA